MSKKIKLEDTDFKQQRQRYFPSKHSLPNLKKKKKKLYGVYAALQINSPSWFFPLFSSSLTK